MWPSQAEKQPRPQRVPRLQQAGRPRAGGAASTSGLLDVGVAGIWNDMNEPAVFDRRRQAPCPLDVRHDNEGQPTDHREIHNVYGHADDARRRTRACARCGPSARPFVLTRATFAGGQRYAAIWPGDNVSRLGAPPRQHPHARWASGLSGLPVRGQPTSAASRRRPRPSCSRAGSRRGVFYPFMRTHTTFGTPDQEPWSYGTRHEELEPPRHRAALRAAARTSTTSCRRRAAPACPRCGRCSSSIPDDPAHLRAATTQFLFGGDLLVAPVLREGVTERERVPARRASGSTSGPGGASRAAAGTRLPVTLESMPDLRARRRVRLPPARRAAHGRDGGPAAARLRLPGRALAGRLLRGRRRGLRLPRRRLRAPHVHAAAGRAPARGRGLSPSLARGARHRGVSCCASGPMPRPRESSSIGRRSDAGPPAPGARAGASPTTASWKSSCAIGPRPSR